MFSCRLTVVTILCASTKDIYKSGWLGHFRHEMLQAQIYTKLFGTMLEVDVVNKDVVAKWWCDFAQ